MRRAFLLLLLAACSVPRAEPRPVDVTAFPTEANLLRAREALQDRIAGEREHVAALQQQLSTLRTDEERLYAIYLEAEADYQLRESDLAGVEQDLAAAQQALAETQVRLAQAQAQLQAAQQQLVGLLATASAVLDALARLEVALREGRADEVAALRAQLPAQFLAAPPPPAVPAGEAPPAEVPAPEPAEPGPEGGEEGEEGAAPDGGGSGDS